ncbi:MAG: ABC transporter permease [Gammaproteobacteria bacterium]|nr:ABC transporter permease [Gammaproteobacteria bacterium]
MSLWRLVKQELSALMAHPSARITVFLGALGYALLYPLPYANQQPHDVMLGVVDPDASSLSRQLIRALDATPQIEVQGVYSDQMTARKALEEQVIRGILVLPPDFEQRLKSHQGTTISYVGDGAYYLLYATQAEGVMNAVGDLNETLASEIQLRLNPRAVSQDVPSFELSMMNAFNTELGYRNYVVPAVFLLILHQLALMGVATMTWTRGAQTLKLSWWRETSARVLAFSAVFLLLALIYFAVIVPAYEIPTQRLGWLSVFYLLTFFLPVILLGQCIGRFVEHPQHAVVFVILTSMPIVFAAGFIWPSASVPSGWLYLVSVFPATHGIGGWLAVYIYGASLDDVKTILAGLLLLSLAFGGLDFWLRRRLQRRSRANVC